MAVPTVSQIHTWDTDHRKAAANHWETHAQVWQVNYDEVYRRVPCAAHLGKAASPTPR
ncbi:hypothetical protein [Mycobacterium sp.]|uniref:hypothetical protein n=1 Tax=Mycobacterium sp. TaxID=1785 RepID=UPI002D319E1E|nr:hypothetical protein [Mycobacterium sp.]HZA08826.1 hypothetical protein [Mycobacterium sp.]